MPLYLRLPFLFLLGMFLGALINLCIYRLAYLRRRISPWGFTRGLVGRRSFVDRIPIVGWINLRREANTHGSGFWIRPLLIELCFGLLVAGLFWWEVDRRMLITPPLPLRISTLGPAAGAMLNAQFAVHVALLVFMAIATFIDIDEQTVPDAVTVPGTMIALVIAVFCQAAALPALEVDPNTMLWEQLLWPLRFDYPVIDAQAPPAQGLQPLGFVNAMVPKANPFLNGAASLIVGLAIYWLWCFALLPRRWRLGAGIGKAWRVMWRRIAARSEWTWVLSLAIAGTIVLATTFVRGGPAWRGLVSSLIGLAVGGGMIWAIRIIGAAILKREAMGFGDVTLMAMIGAFLGWQPAIIVFFLAPFAGALIGIVQVILRGENVVPYGPYLCLAAFVVIFFWAPIWNYAGPMFAIPWLVPSAIGICLPLLALLLFAWKKLRDRFISAD